MRLVSIRQVPVAVSQWRLHSRRGRNLLKRLTFEHQTFHGRLTGLRRLSIKLIKLSVHLLEATFQPLRKSDNRLLRFKSLYCAVFCVILS